MSKGELLKITPGFRAEITVQERDSDTEPRLWRGETSKGKGEGTVRELGIK